MVHIVETMWKTFSSATIALIIFPLCTLSTMLKSTLTNNHGGAQTKAQLVVVVTVILLDISAIQI